MSKKWWGCSVSRSYTPCTVRSYDTLKGCFSATLGEEPEVDGGAGLAVTRSWHAHGPAGMECSQKLVAGTWRTANE